MFDDEHDFDRGAVRPSAATPQAPSPAPNPYWREWSASQPTAHDDNNTDSHSNSDQFDASPPANQSTDIITINANSNEIDGDGPSRLVDEAKSANIRYTCI